MPAPNRATLIGKVQKVLKKYFKPINPTHASVLETLVFACCLENSRYEKAEDGFRKLQDRNAFVDWNEVRVASVSELSEYLSGCAHPRSAAANVKRCLHNVFENLYSWDLEPLKKQNLGKTVQTLEKYTGGNQFIVAYVTQHALGGHSIPLDSGALDMFQIVGVIDDKEREKGVVPGLERAVPKKKGPEFASLLHQMSAELVASPYSTNVKSMLLEMNADAQSRLPKRTSKRPAAKDETTEAAASTAADPATEVAAKESKSAKKKKKPAADTQAKPSESKKPAGKPAPPKKKSTQKGTSSPTSAAKSGTSKKKTTAKSITRRKPR
ncbi:MAG: hypothetical protein R3E01_04665 [Pirellulaceae bacterium]|nr:hypothetical protein [Planctomycetales bacterium]